MATVTMWLGLFQRLLCCDLDIGIHTCDLDIGLHRVNQQLVKQGTRKMGRRPWQPSCCNENKIHNKLRRLRTEERKGTFVSDGALCVHSKWRRAKGTLGCHLPPSLIFLLSQAPKYANIRVLKDIKYCLTSRVTQNCLHRVTERLFHSKHAKSNIPQLKKFIRTSTCFPKLNNKTFLVPKF